MEEIGAYYQCYNRKESTNFVLKNFRLHYPTSNCVLICDGGLDFSKASKEYNCFYLYENRIANVKNLVFNDPKYLFEFINRMAKYIKKIQEDFFMILEDDVFVMSNTNISDLIYDINGCNFGEFLDKSLYNLIKDKNPNKIYEKGLFSGACGGSILRNSFFIEHLSNNESLGNDIIEYCKNSNQNNWASDRFLSYLCWKYGGNIGQYKGFCETWYQDYNIRMKNKDIEVLHQYKDLY